MIDTHTYPDNWGVRPILFNVGNFEVPSYSVFVLLGLLVGLAVYYSEAKKKNQLNENGLFIVIGSLVGGVLGAKIMQWIIDYKLILANLTNPEILLSGRTIIGGLIGGTIGAIITKKYLGIKEKRGNLFAPAIALGVAVGRIGCFLRGCCYGKETSLPWGVDFGDGLFRHPTQLYESLFMLAMFFILQKIKKRDDIKPGQLFKILMISYFSFRFVVEFIRVEPIAFFDLSVFQIISIIAILYLVKGNIAKLIIKLQKYGRE